MVHTLTIPTCSTQTFLFGLFTMHKFMCDGLQDLHTFSAGIDFDAIIDIICDSIGIALDWTYQKLDSCIEIELDAEVVPILLNQTFNSDCFVE